MSGDEARLAWRSWAAQASPELLAAFNGLTRDVMIGIRKDYPPMLDPKCREYAELRAKCSCALFEIAQEYDPNYFNGDD